MFASLPANAVTINEFPIPTVDSFPGNITAGPDGNLWFTEYNVNGNKIGRITTSGTITHFTLPSDGRSPSSITVGPDGNLWFTEYSWYYVSEIGHITTSGIITQFTLPSGSDPGSITTGPDGNLWFTEPFGNKIGRLTPDGVVTEFTVPTRNSFYGTSSPRGITAGPDGNLWFTEGYGNKIGRITTIGDITEFTLRSDSEPSGIAAGPDGNLWFTEWSSNGGNIGRITTAGVITEFAIPSGNSALDIAAGPDGNIWFTEENGNNIGRILLGTTYKSTLTITETGSGTGTVTSSPAGISCGSTCTALFNTGAVITLTATPTTGVNFGGWTGGNFSSVSFSSVSTAGTFTLINDTTITADFRYGSFDDETNNVFAPYINAIYNAGITQGCGNGDYCPSENVTRGQTAAFIIRALYGETFPYSQTPYFTDVPSSDTFFKYIQKMKDMGITAVSGTYSPGSYVTRDQMAAFIIRALQVKNGQNTETFTYTATPPYFSDVPTTDPFFKYVQKLKDKGITSANGTYNAATTITRDQMAAFIAKAFLSYGIYGTVWGPGGIQSGVTMTLSGDDSKTTTVQYGQYAFSSLTNHSHIITPSKPGFTFNPSSTLVTNGSGFDILGVDFTAVPLPVAGTYSISGQVVYSGAGLSGVIMTISGSSSAIATTDTSGKYTFGGLADGSYTITPRETGIPTSYNFTPSSTTQTINGQNLSGVDFTATPTIVRPTTISGTVTLAGAGLPGITMMLSGDVSVATVTDISGNYSFGGLTNGSYTITPNLVASTGAFSFNPWKSIQTVNGSGFDIAGVNFTAAQIPVPTP